MRKFEGAGSRSFRCLGQLPEAQGPTSRKSGGFLFPLRWTVTVSASIPTSVRSGASAKSL